MTDTEQTYLKQRFAEGKQVDSNYGNQPSVCHEFIDIRDSSLLKTTEGAESKTELTAAKTLEEDRKSEVTVNEQLRKRIRDLEKIVFWQNEEIRNSEVQKRNYDAALRRLQRQELEASLLTEDRERYYDESVFYRLQAQERTKLCEKYEERIRHMNLCLVEKDRKIRDLERQAMFFKENTRHEADDRIPSNGLLLFKKPEGSPYESGTDTDQDGSQVKRRRRDFRTSLTSLPKCTNCQTVFDVLKPHEVDCSFHRVPPQPLKVWKSQLDIHDNKIGSLDLNSYRFWPCCEKYGVKEPPGCLTFKSHEIVYPDEE